MRHVTTSVSLTNSESCSPLEEVHPRVVLDHSGTFSKGMEIKKATGSFSQVNRRSVMCENAKLSQAFMEEQHHEITSCIKQFQLFIGYLEQLPSSPSISTSKHAWSVYLMHAQSLDNSLIKSFKGKNLFGDGINPPIRVHLEKERIVKPFDLPDPPLSAMHGIRSFLAGVIDHRLPSIQLCNSCMAELLDALVCVQRGKEELSIILKELKSRKANNELMHSVSLIHKTKKNLSARVMSKLIEALRVFARPFRHIIAVP